MATNEGKEMSSGGVRDAIFSQHAALRGLLAELVAATESALHAERMHDLLRARARDFYDKLAAHMAFEEEVLPAALRDVIGWGAVIQEKMEADHLKQREALAEALAALGPEGPALPSLVADVRSFAATVLVDMESEEHGLLQADLDALTLEVKGG
jgi:hemerythrin-like domain-containing protein